MRNTIPLAQRRKARQLIMQALYQWLMTKDDPLDIAKQYHEDNPGKIDWEYFDAIFRKSRSSRNPWTSTYHHCWIEPRAHWIRSSEPACIWAPSNWQTGSMCLTGSLSMNVSSWRSSMAPQTAINTSTVFSTSWFLNCVPSSTTINPDRGGRPLARCSVHCQALNVMA